MTMQKNNRERNNAPQRPSAAGKGREGRNAGKPQEAAVAQTKAQAKAARDDAALQQEVDRTVEALRRGGLVLYPTDTVWGLGCDATNAEAVERIYRLKRSENKKSMLVLCATADMVVRYVDKAPAIAFEVMELATSPLTAILPGATGLAANLIPDEGTLGVRIPDHAFCQRMLRAFGRPVVSTSANISGEATPACRRLPGRSSTAWISSSTPASRGIPPARPRRSSPSAKAAR